MGKIAIMLWVIVAPTIGGILFLIGLNVPQLANNGVVLAGMAIAGFILAMPISFVVAKKIVAAMQPPKRA